ncbi:hypothetical protein COO91_02003 [Nostoc flagelliforme CCNUN1]|uniref:Uncharacterized protein n=1 Tax=Nostoc flagelliforme CCNUN1 TaxID=2038116 RepID=A0A2K8SKY0_9NOSO|nr:hypothetical protein [Nostoc flagelliforme]AUB36102.1 hypothetical protein COO91_02003 [Nostoc flagelliforme CCNUN1]
MSNHQARQNSIVANQARSLAEDLGVEIVKNQITSKKYDYRIEKDGEIVRDGLPRYSDVLSELHKLGKEIASQEIAEDLQLATVTAPELVIETEPEAIAIEETAPNTVELSLEEIEPPTEIEAPVIVPTVVTSHLKPQFKPARIDLKQTTSQELKEQVLALLGLQTASQAAKWAKEQGMVVDLCYKSHWAAVLEKAQDSLTVAA